MYRRRSKQAYLYEMCTIFPGLQKRTNKTVSLGGNIQLTRSNRYIIHDL